MPIWPLAIAIGQAQGPAPTKTQAFDFIPFRDLLIITVCYKQKPSPQTIMIFRIIRSAIFFFKNA